MTVHSTGGLGNQLFIYAAGIAATSSSDGRLRVDTGLHRGPGARPFLLQQLGFPAEYVDLDHTVPTYGLRGRLKRGSIPHACSFRERTARYDDRLLTLSSGTCMFGHFQCWQYVDRARGALRTEFSRLVQESSSRIGAAADLMRSRKSVAVHVRRGDYLDASARQFHGLAGPRYYADAVDTVRGMGFDGPVYLFSDEPAAAAAELAPLGQVETFADLGLDAIDELLLMSAAPALVMANSSFSWWAGWVGDRAGRPVIAPRPWFDEATVDARDLLPPDWLTLGRAEAALKRTPD